MELLLSRIMGGIRVLWVVHLAIWQRWPSRWREDRRLSSEGLLTILRLVVVRDREQEAHLLRHNSNRYDQLRDLLGFPGQLLVLGDRLGAWCPLLITLAGTHMWLNYRKVVHRPRA